MFSQYSLLGLDWINRLGLIVEVSIDGFLNSTTANM